MAQITEVVNVQNILKTSVSPAAGFGLQLFLVDDNQIPVNQRYVLVTKDSYSDSFSSESTPYKYAQTFFAQALTPASLMVGRWISAATSPYFVCGASSVVAVATLEAIDDGEIKITDSGAHTDTLSDIDFSGITTYAQFLGKINTALAAVETPNITGLASAAFSVNALGRTVLSMATTGSAAPTISIQAIATPAGTDLSTVFDISNGASVAGFDAESLVQALAAIEDLNNDFYNIHQRGGSDAQVIALASQVETERKLLDVVVSNVTAKTSATTDLGKVLQALSLNRTLVIYSEKGEYPDAAMAGRVFPAAEGKLNFGYKKLSLVTQSGTTPLTTSQKAFLDDKGYCRIETVKNTTFMTRGLCISGEEKRLVFGSDWLVTRIAEGIFTIHINADVMAFDNDSISQVESVVRQYLDIALFRKIIVNTDDRPIQLNFPDSDDIETSMRASHKLTVQDGTSGQGPAWVAYVNSAINDYKIVGEWRI